MCLPVSLQRPDDRRLRLFPALEEEEVRDGTFEMFQHVGTIVDEVCQAEGESMIALLRALSAEADVRLLDTCRPEEPMVCKPQPCLMLHTRATLRDEPHPSAEPRDEALNGAEGTGHRRSSKRVID